MEKKSSPKKLLVYFIIIDVKNQRLLLNSWRGPWNTNSTQQVQNQVPVHQRSLSLGEFGRVPFPPNNLPILSVRPFVGSSPILHPLCPTESGRSEEGPRRVKE